MILHNSFYRISNNSSFENAENLKNEATISFIRESEIFNAHFPTLPIVPGACLVQISKECLEKKLQQNIQILQFKNLKFLKTINPDEFPEIEIGFLYQKNEDNYSASVTFYKDKNLFCKLDYFFILQ